MRSLILHRYMIRQFLSPFCIALVTFTFILVLHYLFLMMDMFLNRGVDLWIIMRMSSLVLTMLLPLSIPMATLLAALLTYGRLSEDGELIALRSSGCALFQYSSPNFILALCFSLILVYFNLILVPQATRGFKELHLRVVQKNPLALFAPKVMNHFGEYKVFVEQMDRRKKKLKGISIYKMNLEGGPTRILAPEGMIDSQDGITLQLVNGALHQPSPEKENEYSITKFNKLALRMPTQEEDSLRVFSPREMTLRELKNKMKEEVGKKFNIAPLQTEKHLRISVAFAPFVFIILGTALGVPLKKGGKSVSIGISIIIIVIYYGLLVLSTSLASQGFLFPIFWVWIPNLTALALGLPLLFRLAKQ
ncbi:MAG: LptF/LptG family permease [Elusimicrobia bacterium]|nr:LptF/LptG family permease [Elusimicrobiota bacterium]